MRNITQALKLSSPKTDLLVNKLGGPLPVLELAMAPRNVLFEFLNQITINTFILFKKFNNNNVINLAKLLKTMQNAKLN